MSASQSIGLGSIPLSSHIRKILDIGIDSFLIGALNERDRAEKKKGISLVACLGKVVDGILPPLRGKQMVELSSPPIVVVQSDQGHANRARAHTHK